jgi:hypothetical protein
MITSPAVLAVDHWLPTGLRRLRPAVGLAAAVVLAAMVYAFVAGIRAAVPVDQRPWLTAVLFALAFWVLLRAGLLLWMAPRHARFEAAWLDAQSQVLRRASFQVVRFGLQRGRYVSDTVWFDLTTATGVQAVLDAVKRDDQADTWAVIEFCYPADGHIRLERTVRPIIDVLLRCDSAMDEDASRYRAVSAGQLSARRADACPRHSVGVGRGSAAVHGSRTSARRGRAVTTSPHGQVSRIRTLTAATAGEFLSREIGHR